MTIQIPAQVAGWPADKIRTVSLTNPQAEFDDLATAVSDVNAGDVIWLDAGTYTLAASLIIGKGLTIAGISPEDTIITSSGAYNTITVTSTDVTLVGLTITNTSTTNIKATVSSNQNNTTLRNCVIGRSGTISGDYAYAVWLSGGTGWQIDNCRIDNTSTATFPFVVFLSATAVTCEVISSWFNGVSTEAAFFVKNVVTPSAGAETYFGDIGYLNEAGEYDETTTEGDNVAWCIALTDGITNGQTLVKRRENAIVNYAGGSPNAGEFLITSTTPGIALVSVTMHPAIFAVCTAAGVGGASGTVAVQLLTGSVRINTASSNWIYTAITSGNYASPFAAVIDDNAGAHGGQGLDATHVPYDGASGNVNTLPAVDTTNLCRVRLYNASGTIKYREIDYVDTVNTVFYTSDGTGDGWADNHVITCVSQDIGVAAAIKHYDLKFRDVSTVPLLARSIALQIQTRDSAVGAPYTAIHPVETYSAAKLIVVLPQVNSVYLYASNLEANLINGSFGWATRASGAATLTCFLSVKGYVLAVP